MFWEPQRIWKGASVAIVGGGPSLTKEQVAAVRDAGFRTIGVNDAYLFGVAIDICFWGDRLWYFGNPVNGHPGHRERVLKWPGLRVTCCMDCVDEPGVYTLIRERSEGLHPPPRIKWYANSGWTALGLAVMLGARRVVLIGFDGRAQGARYNWHPDNASGADASVFGFHKESGRQCAKDIAAWPDTTGIQIWNCTPGSAYDAFPCAELGEVLCQQG